MNFKKLLLAAMLLPAGFTSVKADEGMWIPSLIGKNYADMQKMGLKLTADDIYNINKSSMKDAIVSLGFCTGELISAQGLMLTNHHCAFSSIQFNSSVEHDYLTNGFWAKTQAEELQAPGITASILQKIVDVTETVHPQLKGLGSAERAAKIKEIETKMTEEYTKGDKGLTAQLKEMFYGNQFFVYVYEKFTDVRLVGAPPSSIGKFGGDTDNWMWPRHTGDFSMFRIYANKENKPAAYSKDNVPYKSKSFLPISMKGIQDNDYTMILGYPGRTNRYASSYEMQNAIDVVNPALIEISGKKLELMKQDMNASDEVRIKLASKYASMSNSWKYYIGQNAGLKKLKVVDQKREDEDKFTLWVKGDDSRQPKYGKIFSTLDSAYKAYRPNYPIQLYYQQAGLGTELAQIANSFTAINTELQKSPVDTTKLNPMIRESKAGLDKFYKDYSMATDKKVFANMLVLMHKHLTEAQLPTMVKEALAENKGLSPEQAFEKYADKVYSNTMFVNKDKVLAFLANPTADVLNKDATFAYVTKTTADYKALLPTKNITEFNNLVSRQKEAFIAGFMDMNKGKNFYPDANSSLRLTYGKVDDYSPADGAEYSYYTTTDGILQKEDPKSDEFNVPQKLVDLIKKKDFGPYADKNGKMHVAFISTTDITGGNSGSPVINGQGQLVGTAFDGNWEAMSGDLVFDKKYKRTISVDVRYVLFIIDKYADAGNLIKEMKLVN